MTIVVKLCYAALCAVLAGALVLSGSGASLALLAACLALPLLMLPVSLYGRKHLRVTVGAPVNAEKQETVLFRVCLENGARLPLVAAACRVEVTNLLTGAKETFTRRTAVLPRGRSEIVLPLSSDCCGRLRAEVTGVRLYDCFWLIPVRCAADAHGAVTVQPETFPMSVTVRTDVSCPDESEVYSQERPGNDVTEVFQLRDYREGDSIRQIHWKLSTKYDRLISRDPSLPVTRSLLLFWERRTAEVSRVRQDAQAEALASLSRALLAMDTQFTIGWNDAGGRCILHPVRELDDLIALLPRLLSATAFTGGPDGPELYCATERAHAYAHVVYLSEAPSAMLGQMSPFGVATLLLCGSADAAVPEGTALRCFTPETCAEALMDLEL